MQDVISPVTLSIVAGASISHPIVDIIINASAGKPYSDTISISPIKPPPGIPDITTPLNTEINNAIIYESIPILVYPKILNKNNIFKTNKCNLNSNF